MDDNEFHRRVLSDPHGHEHDLHEAARGDSARQRLIEEITEFEQHLSSAVTAVSVPGDLADQLKNQIRPSGRAGTGLLRGLSVAALVLVAAAITLVPGLSGQPAASDLAFHDALTRHLHEEAATYEGETSIDWPQASAVLASAGLRETGDDGLRTASLKFARLCDLGEQGRGAHLVLRGKNGPVSVIFATTTPVEQAMEVDDPRFQGRILPGANGNIAIVGERGEALTRYETLARSSVHWSL